MNLGPADDAVEDVAASLAVGGEEMEMVAGNIESLHEVRGAEADQSSSLVLERKDALLPGGIGQRGIRLLLARDATGLRGLDFNLHAKGIKGIGRRQLPVELLFKRMQAGDVGQDE